MKAESKKQLGISHSLRRSKGKVTKRVRKMTAKSSKHR